MTLSRRSFFTGLSALIVVPAVIRVADLMPIKVWHGDITGTQYWGDHDGTLTELKNNARIKRLDNIESIKPYRHYENILGQSVPDHSSLGPLTLKQSNELDEKFAAYYRSIGWDSMANYWLAKRI